MVVYSYGGGEILYNIFQGVAKLHNAGFLKQLFYIGGIAGLMLMIIKLFFSNASPIELVRKWFLPVLLGLSLLILPKTSVMVKDIITGTEKAVGNVPYGLAIMARLSSHVGHLITRGIEQAMHVPDHLQYNKTGHVFGAENLMDIGNFRWTDPVTEENMRNFVVNCVAYDLMLGRYSLKDLKHRPKLWPFTKEKTSKNRGIYWIPAETQDSPQREPKYCSCREAAGRLDTCFKEEISIKKRDPKFAKYLPQAFQALTKLSRSADEIIMQQLMHHSYVDGLENKSVALGLGHNFAASRAYMQQQSTMQIAGSLAGKSIVIIRAIFEALILVSFIFIVPMMALPMGISYFGKWAEMVIWVNLWPPVYAVLNFILQASAQAKAKVIVDLYEGGSEKGLNLAMATPLATLYNDMVAYAGWASTFVPVLAYMILKGGMASFVHIAGNMMNASQSAAGAAAQELTTGNYSFGNVSREVMNSNISHMNQFRDAPSMQSGFFHVSTGSSDVTYGSDGSAVYRQQVSSLPINFSMSQLISSNLNRQASESMQLAHTEGVNFAHSMDMVTRELTSLDQHMGSSSSANISKSHGMDESTQKSIHSMMSQARSFGERHGMDANRAVKFLAGLSLGANIGKSGEKWGAAVGASIGINGSGDYSGSASYQEMLDEAQSITTTKDFQENMSNIQRYSENQNWSEGQDEGKRLAESLSSSFGRSQSYINSMSENLTKAESLSEQATLTKDNSARIDRNLSQDFFNFMIKKEGGIQNAISVLESADTNVKDHVDDRIQEFYTSAQEKVMQYANPNLKSKSAFWGGKEAMNINYHKTAADIPGITKNVHQENKTKLKDMSGLNDVSKNIDKAHQSILHNAPNVAENISAQKNELQTEQKKAGQKYKNEMERSTLGRAVDAFNFLSSFGESSNSKKD